jgi:hypothetical protein
LLQPRLPRQFLRSPLEILRLLLQLTGNVGDVVESFAAIENLINVLSHNGLNFRQVLMEFATTAATIASISVITLFALNNWIVMNESKWTSCLIDFCAPLSHFVRKER